jgi:molecular chaperone HtpG
MNTAEKHHFQAEIQQVLDIVIHSLYQDREVFIRELISNAADACERLRFLQASGQAVHQPEIQPTIAVAVDEQAHTITFTDTGVGMTRAELVDNLGTIAHSGTKAFLRGIQAAEQQTGDPGVKANLIGQFGVGFYSAFMVANKVTVNSRSHQIEEPGWRWISEGAAGYEIEAAPDLPRGTSIVLTLKDDAKEFGKTGTIERVIQRYSNFVQFPIELNGRRINSVQAIWARNKSEIKPEEYQEFYHYVARSQEDPLFRLHFAADAPLSIQALLFVPAHNLESLGLARTESEVHLYCRKVLIQARAKGLLPEWLRFLKGVVDSEDMPLNISRETMQDTSLMQKLSQVLTGRFLKFLEDQATKEAGTYEKFYAQYSRFLKEGIVTDFGHRESLGRLLRFESSHTEPSQMTSLADYVKRMPSDQKEIFGLLGPNRESAETSPYFEVFRARKFEVLFFYDPWDEFVMEHLQTFDNKPLQLAEKAELDTGDTPKNENALGDTEATALATWLKEKLGARVHEVRVSRRLIESPAVVVDHDKFVTASMRRIMKSLRKGEDAQAAGKQDLEINPAHAILIQLDKSRQADPELALQVAEQLLDNAFVAAGLLEDPRRMVNRMNALLARVLQSKLP